jgi:hypothetical protein
VHGQPPSPYGQHAGIHRQGTNLDGLLEGKAERGKASETRSPGPNTWRSGRARLRARLPA